MTYQRRNRREMRTLLSMVQPASRKRNVSRASGDDPEVGQTESASDRQSHSDDPAHPLIRPSDSKDDRSLNKGAFSVSEGAPTVSKGAPSVSRNRDKGLLPRNAQALLAPIKERFWTTAALAAVISGAAILLAVIISLALVPAAAPGSYMSVQGIGVPFNLSWQGYRSYLQQLQPLQQHVGLPSIPFHPLPRGPHGFIQFSAYRLSSRSFAVVGFGAHYLKDHLCIWQGSNGLELKAEPTIIYTNLREESDYDAIVMRCELDQSTGDAGGDLFLNIASEPFLALRESSALQHAIVPPDFDHLPHVLTMCAVRMGREVEARLVHEWVSYHWHLGATQFRLYDAGAMDERHEWVSCHWHLGATQFCLYNRGALDESLATVLDTFLRNDSLKVIPTRQLSFYNIEYDAHSLSALDCLYSTHFTSQWVTVLPPDSYLYVTPPHTLLYFLSQYASKPWLTFGAHEWSTEKCREGIVWENVTTEEWMGWREESPFVVEWLVYRRRENVCEGDGEDKDREKCIGKDGQRSHFTNPRKVRARVGWRENVCEGDGEDKDREKCIGKDGQRSHFTNPRKAGVLGYYDVRETDSGGGHVLYSEMHKNVYPNLHERSEFGRTCREVTAAEEWDGWVRDVTAADYAKQLRKSTQPTA
ncbi:unnamed protein product [Closterium sp. Yama58-4]|nr:unnamed protein product [Closterium sp. Yama58-4]